MYSASHFNIKCDTNYFIYNVGDIGVQCHQNKELISAVYYALDMRHDTFNCWLLQQQNISTDKLWGRYRVERLTGKHNRHDNVNMSSQSVSVGLHAADPRWKLNGVRDVPSFRFFRKESAFCVHWNICTKKRATIFHPRLNDFSQFLFSCYRHSVKPPPQYSERYVLLNSLSGMPIFDCIWMALKLGGTIR